MDSNSEKNALALQVIPRGWNASDIGDQSGKHFLITGATSGIGLESARELIRARKTAEALAKLAGLEVHIDPDLRETNGGNWEGKTGEQNRAEDYHRFVHWLDGDDERAGEVGEKRSEIATRAVRAIEKGLRGDVSTLIVATHGGTARCILGKMLDMPMKQWSSIGGLSNASWSILENGHHRSGWVLVEHNSGSLPEPIYGEESGA